MVEALIACEREGPGGEVYLVNLVEDEPGTEAFCMFLKAFHEFGAQNTRMVGGPVVDIGGGHELTSLR
jgi:hypothetical protein